MASPPFDILQAKPADTDLVSQHPADERLMRDIVESWLLVDHDTSGRHNKVTLPERTDPTAVANTGFLYAKDDAGDTELFYRDDSGNIVKITEDGAVTGVAGATFPSGTKMLFVQASAPSGWTKDVDQNDRVLRVVSGTPGSGGSWTISGLTSPTHTHTMKNHKHETPASDSQGGARVSNVNTAAWPHGTSGTNRQTVSVAATSNQSVNTLLSGPPNDNTTDATAASITSDASWRPLHLDCIKATKN